MSRSRPRRSPWWRPSPRTNDTAIGCNTTWAKRRRTDVLPDQAQLFLIRQRGQPREVAVQDWVAPGALNVEESERADERCISALAAWFGMSAAVAAPRRCVARGSFVVRLHADRGASVARRQSMIPQVERMAARNHANPSGPMPEVSLAALMEH